MLAIDSQNALFVSKDAGSHWEAVHPQWPGHAIRVSLVSTPNSHTVNAAAPASTKAVFGSVRSAQFASLTGAVTDPTGAAIPSASVALSDTSTGVIRRAETDSAGNYTFSELVPGVYNVTAQAPGFKSQSIGSLEVHPDGSPAANPPANFKLQVAESNQTVSVSADALSIETTPEAFTTRAKAKSAAPPAPLFEITTDSGQVFTSADGLAWAQKK
jgi:hypothetical protein